MKKFKAIMTVSLSCLVVLGSIIGAASADTINAETTNASETTTETSSTEKTTTYAGLVAGSPADVTISDVHSPDVKSGEQAIIGFDLNLNRSDNCLLAKIYVKDGTSSAYIADQGLDAYIPLYGNYQRCDFFLNTKKDIATGYYPVSFVIEYVKVDADGQITNTYYVEKSVDIYIIGKDGEKSDSDVSVPRIIVTGFETNPEKVMAGDEFELKVHIQNTSSQTTVSNVKVSLSSANNEFLPSSGSSTEFIRSIGCGAEKDIVINMKAQASLEQKPYVLSVKFEYEGEKNKAYESTESISIPVYQEVKTKITNVEVNPGSIETYSQANVMFSINNTGKSKLFNVQVAVDPDNQSVQADDCFVGNIESGATGYVDFMVNGIAATTDDGKVKLIVSYEDASGEPGSFETEIDLFVYEPAPYDPSIDFPIDEPTVDEKASFPVVWLIVGAVVVVIVVVVTLIVIKKKKQKALEEDFEDEIS